MLCKPCNTCSYVPFFPTQAPCCGHRTQVLTFLALQPARLSACLGTNLHPREIPTGAQTKLQGGWNFALNVELKWARLAPTPPNPTRNCRKQHFQGPVQNEFVKKKNKIYPSWRPVQRGDCRTISQLHLPLSLLSSCGLITASQCTGLCFQPGKDSVRHICLRLHACG